MPRILSFLLLVFFSGCVACASTPAPVLPPAQQMQLDKHFDIRAEMPFAVDGLNYVGFAAIELKKHHVIKLTLPKSVDFVQVDTCHRWPQFKNPTNPLEFVYDAVHMIEDNRSCFMTIKAASKEAPMSLAVIEWWSPLEVSMPAWITCDAVSKRAGGASICEIAENKIQRITFDEEVICESGKDCNPISCDGAGCEWHMSRNYCSYMCLGMKSSKFHRLLTRGIGEK
jgi:hypothetical protein